MLRRHLSRQILDSLSAFPVVLLIGARQVGKTTLVREIARKEWRARYVTLDDRTVLDAALIDPDGFLSQIETPAVIDEVQRAPDLLRAVKLTVDRDHSPGMFLLTGSANVLTLSSVSETLAGRVAVHELHPLSWTELDVMPPSGIIDALFTASSAKTVLRRLTKWSPEGGMMALRALVLSGGYPKPALMRKKAQRRTWFESYRQTYIERDLRDLSNIAHLPDFTRLLTTLSLRTGQIANYSALSREIGLPVTTLRRYVNILQQTFQVFLVQPYAANIGKRLVRAPKLYITDTGLACHMSGAYLWDDLARQHREGALLETWFACELRKLLSLETRPTLLSYWRTRTGREVDYLLERGSDVVGIEVKSAGRIRKRDLAGLASCREALGRRWRLGVLAHGGEEAVALDEKTLAVPIAGLLGR